MVPVPGRGSASPGDSSRRSGKEFTFSFTQVCYPISSNPVSAKSEKIKTAVDKPARSKKFLHVLSFCTSPIGTGIISKIYSVARSLTITEE